jgi:N-methylhydantoinase B
VTNLPCDAGTFEIIRHKLTAVVEEAIIALENVSGSPITNEGHDMMVSLYRPNGDLMVGGVGYLYHLTSASQAVKHLIATYGSDPGIEEGDVYLMNDAYTAALHPPDMYVISPIHQDGLLIGFVANFVHLTDIGAITPGGFSPDATDTYQEGFVTQGLKLVARGQLRRDVFDTVLNNVRDPGMTALDLRSQMAANHTAKERMADLCSAYGFGLVDAVCAALIDIAEERLRARLLGMPDGTWHARQYIDIPSGVRRVALAMNKTGDALAFDFTGTDPQADVGINGTWWGSWGGIFGALFPLLAWDIPWNDGVTRPISMLAPEGSLVHAQRPAPISIATIGVVKVVSSLAGITIGKMLLATPDLASRATATWKGTHMNFEIFGKTKAGHYFVTLMTDSFAGAAGARAFADGVDLGGELPNQVGRWANAETQETNVPLRYLFRSPVRDSGGPGRFRGGVSHDIAIVPDGTADGSFEVGLFGLGLEVPYSQGIAGGYAGCHVDFRLGPTLPASAGGEDFAGAGTRSQWGHFRVGAGDSLYVRGTGGGGFGDPLERDPSAVERDVEQGLVSRAEATRAYGVVLTPTGGVDPAATASARDAARVERLGRRPDRTPSQRSATAGERQLGDALVLDREGPRCVRCDFRFAGDVHWKDNAHSRRSQPDVAGPRRDGGRDVQLLELFCPSCATLLDVELVHGADEPLRDVVRI